MKPRPGPPKGTTRTIRLDIQYDGTNYVGWQRQPKGISIQGLLEKAISKVASEKVTLFGASRTDAGVHALNQVASFSLKKSIAPIEAFRLGVNSMMPEDIRVVQAQEAELSFFAGQDAKKKMYRYFLHIARGPFVFTNRYAWHLKWPVDMGAMQRGADALIGTHDFSSFQASRSDTQTTVRTIFHAAWKHEELDLLSFEVTADGFLKHMVRSIVGTLVEVGWGKRKPEEMRIILDAKARTKAGACAPPQGLFLWKIDF